jgi:hypothetical protein
MQVDGSPPFQCLEPGVEIGKSTGGGTDGGTIAGIVIAVLFVLVLLTVPVLVLRRRKGRRYSPQNQEKKAQKSKVELGMEPLSKQERLI